MPQQPGKLVGPMLWLVPRYAEKPGTIMRLGSILTDPENLESSLNLDDIPPIPDKAKRDASVGLKRIVRTELSKDDSLLVKAIPSIPVLRAGASLGGHWKNSAPTTVEAMNVRATVFCPDKAYMSEALRNAAVIDYARGGLFGKPLYIVVGTATASQLCVREARLSNKGASASASAGVSGPGLAAEAEARVSRGSRTESELEVGEECDFAYRVREFLYSKLSGSLVDKGDRTKKALFRQGRDGVGVVDGTKDIPEFFALEEKDVSSRVLVTLPVPADE